MYTRVAAVVLTLAAAAVAFAQTPLQDARRLEMGAQLYGQYCSTCHGPNGDLAPGVNLRTGQFKRAASDLDIMNTIVEGVPGTAMPKHNLATGELVSLVAYIRAMKDYGARKIDLGDPARGRAIFEGKGKCLTCHRVDNHGSYLGPDLSDIGASRSAAALEDTLLDPEATAAPGDRSIRAVTKDGKEVTGRHLNEDTWTVQIIDNHDRLVSLWKPDLKEYAVIKTPMPSYKTSLTAGERGDLIAYLVSLKPEQPGGRGAGGRGAGGGPARGGRGGN